MGGDEVRVEVRLVWVFERGAAAHLHNAIDLLRLPRQTEGLEEGAKRLVDSIGLEVESAQEGFENLAVEVARGW